MNSGRRGVESGILRLLMEPGVRARDGAWWLAAMARRPAVVCACVLVGMMGIVSAMSPGFATAGNLRDILVNTAPVVVIGCGMTMVILTGEIDISVGSLYGVLAALMGVLASPENMGLPAPLVIALVVGAGALCGLLNGVLVAFAGVPSIIATLGMLTVLRGVMVQVMGGEWITDLPPGLRVLGTGTVAGVPWCLVVAGVTAGATYVLLARTRVGVRVYAVGGNEQAAQYAGIGTRRVKVLVFTATGVLTAVAALVAVTQQSVVEPDLGVGLELIVVTAVLVGGTSISGGVGGVMGTIVAALLLCSLRTMLIFLKLDAAWERAIQGGLILGAVMLDHLARRRGRGAS